MESDLYTYLAALHSVSVYNAQIPQGGGYPVVVFERISTNPMATNMEAGGNLMQYRYQIDHYAETMAAAQALADITQALHARRGTIGTVECVSFLDNERQEYIASIDMYVVSSDYMITSIQ